MQLGTVLVLVGAVLFFVALIVEHHPLPRGTTPLFHTLVAVAGIVTAVGVLLGAPAIHA